ncbi:MAG: hypothetical protein D6790_09695, partial [Caldilineae bacterium]
MTDAEPSEGRLLQGVGEPAHPASQTWTARYDVVVARIDLGEADDPHRLAQEEAQQPARRIGAHMRRQPIAQRIRQVVDEGRVAEVVDAPPVVAVGLEGIPAIGREDHPPTAG